MPHPIVHVNVALNTLATVLMVASFVLIKLGHEKAHRNTMCAAIVASIAFLACYLYYHFVLQLRVDFTHQGPARYVYYAILGTHIPLAMTVPYLTLRSAWLGMKAMQGGDAEASGAARQKHRRVVRWAFPIWLYVSVTGVVVYLMLYHLYPSDDLTG